MDKRFWGIISVIILGVGAFLVLGSDKKPANNVTPTNHVIGATESKVTLLEYGDFQCPGCASFFQVVKQVEQKYAESMKFQFRHLPLSSIHTNAFSAARAAEAASNQGKFWEMHDLLYPSQNTWGSSDDALNDYFVGYAKQLNLDLDKFKADFASNEVNDKINADIDAFKKTGEQMSTPSFFLNGKPVDSKDLTDDNGVPSLDKFSKLIDEELKK